MSVYGYFPDVTSGSGTMEGVPFTPEAGQTIAEAMPGMIGWADITAALTATPGLVAGWTCIITNGVASGCTAPPAPVVTPAAPTSVAVTSTGTPALSGTYSIDANAILNLVAIVDGINAGKGFPNGSSSFPYYDTSGVAHTFTSTAEFVAFAYAIEGYVAALQLIGDGSTTTSLPATPLTIQ